MLDIKFIREHKDYVQEKIRDKRADVDVGHVMELDQRYREKLQHVQRLQEERNKYGKERNVEEGKRVKELLDKAEPELADLKQELDEWLLKLPNLPLEHLPKGGEEANQVIRTVGIPRQFDFAVKDHLAIGEVLDIIDVPRAAKVSGARFAYLKNDGVLLELALIQYALTTLSSAGFSPVFPPVLIRSELTQGLGYWQAGGNENYYLVRDIEETSATETRPHDLYLVGTAEHALVPMHKDETFKADELSKKYVGFSPAFRRESGTYGKDTRGILRVHQFDKVEMVAFVKPEDDDKERAAMLAMAEKLVTDLGLPYQVVQLATGDISFPAAETIDIETWMPGQNRYRETHSISTTTDFQARRLNIKYQAEDEKKFVHILNGTAYAIGRMIIAILENYQNADGSVIIPEALRPYMGKDKIEKK